MVVESFMLADDNFMRGQNYYLYHLDNKNAPPNQWQLIMYDFDDIFYFYSDDPQHDVVLYYFKDLNATEYNPLTNNLLKIPSYKEKYFSYYDKFLTTVFGSTSHIQPAVRYADIMQFILPYVAKDKLWMLSYGMTTSKFVEASEKSVMYLGLRYNEVFTQVKSNIAL